ncbi:hypothetical protein TNCV_915442 [Trichonephila clavipes]|nr:hypothetical protein TNCV_915442 [Trichonephila clavipes]
MAFLEKAEKQDLILLAKDLGLTVSDKMTIIDRNALKGKQEKIAKQHAIEQERKRREFELEKLRLESELHKLRLETESIRSNVRRASYAEDPKTSSNYRISIGRAQEHVKETSAVLMAEATIPVTTIKEEMGIDDLRVVHVKVGQEMVNAVIDTGAQMPVWYWARTRDQASHGPIPIPLGYRGHADVVEGQSIDNRGSIQITSAFGEHEMGELKGSNMEMNDLRYGVVPVSKYLVNDMLVRSSDYEGLIENSQLVRNPAIL